MERVSSVDNQAWKSALIAALSSICRDTPLANAVATQASFGVHLAVFVEPYLTFLLQGKKTVESRFSVNRNAPFEQVQPGDIIVLKKASGPICGVCRVADVWYYRLDPGTWPEIERYAKALCMDDSEFWERKKAASYATLMRVDHVYRVEEFDIDKADPRGWVVLKPAPSCGQRELPLIAHPIIAFSGSSQTGKTTLARQLAKNLHWKLVGFGDFVRLQARKQGFEKPSRQELQDIGQRMVDADVLAFVNEAFRTVSFVPGEPLVIDGIRHKEVLEAIRIASGQPIKLIHLEAPLQIREARAVDATPGDLVRADAHKVESQTNVEIREAADLVVDASNEFDQVFARIQQWVINACHLPTPTPHLP